MMISKLDGRAASANRRRIDPSEESGIYTIVMPRFRVEQLRRVFGGKRASIIRGLMIEAADRHDGLSRQTETGKRDVEISDDQF